MFIVTITRDGLAMHHYYKYCISLYSYYCVLMRVRQSASLTARFCYRLITKIRKINNFLTFLLLCYALLSCFVIGLDNISVITAFIMHSQSRTNTHTQLYAAAVHQRILGLYRFDTFPVWLSILAAKGLSLFYRLKYWYTYACAYNVNICY